ncbi:hypothetical protein GUJ93_ZPchr0013g37853 [Zizania palustris]|uniref:HAUS augmin-like complex subunit 3 N-terminal domain-containing protein n=1 Tax=Zizania palustris TaxID=103762 RepID=A0A8J5WYM1_ZIZPA|nr:hypothetical protein GUJ93_ZPchr0013g37853 [Zizania palustris]
MRRQHMTKNPLPNNMNAVLGKLTASTQELSYYHSEADIGIYLSYCDFQSYITHNLDCTEELNRWFSKKFEKVPFLHGLC